MSKIRYHSLDSLRGIASLQVLIAHSLVAIPMLNLLMYNNPNSQPHTFFFFLIYSPISFLWGDAAAVKVFFVLSGFVLSLPYYTDEKKDPYYPGFFFKRIIRLYLPCLAIILISIICKTLFYKPNTVNEFGEWVKMMWTLPDNSDIMVKVFFLTGNLDYFDRALWTLPPEIKLSIILPLIILLFRWTNKLWNALIILVYVIIWHLLNKMGARNIWPDYAVLYYFTFFILGSVVCKYRFIVTTWINNISTLQYYLFIIIMLYLYTIKYNFFWLPAHLYHTINIVSDYISAVAAIMILCLVLSQRSHRLMNSKLFMFLGKISFSLYLVHIVVIESSAHLLAYYFSPAVTVGIAFVLCFPVAIIFYHLVEVPSLKFANYISKFILSNINRRS